MRLAISVFRELGAHKGALFGVSLLLLACASGRTTPSGAGSEAARRAPSALDTLARGVERLEPTSGVLDALSASARADLEAVVSDLPEARREHIAADVSIAKSRPLLYLLCGGTSPSAHVALATTPHGSEELVAAHLRGGGGALEARASVASRVARRAARRVVDDYLNRIAAPDAPPETYRVLDRALETLGARALRIDLARLVIDRAPTAGNHFALARLLARELDLPRARAALARARAVEHAAGLAQELDVFEDVLSRLDHDVTGGGDEASRLRAARSFIALGRGDRALALLGPAPSEALPLSPAAVRARALVGDDTCPGLPPAVATPALCAAVWAESPAAHEATRLLQEAWQGGQGRTAAALEVYLGFVHVLPLGVHLEGSSDTRRALEGLERLEADLADLEASSASSRLHGLAVFARAFAELLEGEGNRERAMVPTERAADLVESVEAISEDARADPRVEAATLAVASLLVSQRPVGQLLDRLPAAPTRTLGPARRTIALLDALADGDPAVATQRRDALAETMLETDLASERSRWVLLMAEADVAVSAAEPHMAVLRNVAEQLSSAEADPTDLARRARLDRIFLAHRGGALDEARRLLAVDESLTRAEPDALGRLARAAVIVVGALDDRGGSAEPAHEALSSMLADAPNDAVTAFVGMWQEAFAHRARASECRERAACVKRVEQGRKRVRLEERLGPRTAAIVRRGTLPLFAPRFALAYTPSLGVRPMVRMPLSLVPIPVPEAYRAPTGP